MGWSHKPNCASTRFDVSCECGYTPGTVPEAPQCANGCQYAKDVGMEYHSCAGKCLYLDHPENKEVPMNDAVKQPSHYASGGIECIEAIKASMTPEAFKGYLKGNVQKYLWRYEKKIAPAEDLAKAQVYLGWLIAEVE